MGWAACCSIQIWQCCCRWLEDEPWGSFCGCWRSSAPARPRLPLLLAHLFMREKIGRERRKQREKIVEGIISRGTILMPQVRSGSKASVRSFLSCPAVILRTQCILSCAGTTVPWFSASQCRQVKINPKKALEKKDHFLQLRDGAPVSQLSWRSNTLWTWIGENG